MPDELCDPNSVFSTIIITNSILFFSDHLCLSYVILFSPHLLKLASFLSPLFFTTFIVFIAVINQERDDGDDDLGMCEALFGTCLMNCLNEESPLEILEKQESDLDFDAREKNPGPVSEFKNIVFPGIQGRRMENFLKILDQFERMSTGAVEKKTMIGCNVDHGDDGVRKDRRKLKPEVLRAWDRDYRSNSLDSAWSMREEKEWKRTLACKLFEERQSVDGGDGMDSLWEAYEVGSNKPAVKQMSRKKARSKKRSEIQFDIEGYENDQEDEDEVVGARSCLNAIKFSTEKMNLGSRNPNLVKMSKAISGYGWLHHVSKHSKKVHNNNGDRLIDRY